MPNPLSLQVTPGATVSDDTVVDAAVLNRVARPTVLVPVNSIPPDVLQISAVLAALMAAGGDSLRGHSFLSKGNFWHEDWESPSVEVAAGAAVETAAGWTLAPAGGAVTAARAQDAPDTLSTWCAQLTGGAGVTGLDYYTFVPSGIAGSLRDTSLTFSLWIKNLYSATAQVQAFISPANGINTTESVTEADSSGMQTFAGGAWTRLVWTFETNGMEGLVNGFRIGIRTASLNSGLKSLYIAQAQLEASTVAGPWMRPAGSADQSLQRLPLVSQEEMAMGAHALVQLASGALRRLPNPLSADAFLGFNAQIGAPRWANADSIILTYSGREEIVVIPPDVTEMEIHAWGAAGGLMLGYPGGVGGYTWGRMAVTAGQQYTAIIGQMGNYATPLPVFGFGGSAANNVDGGGGLSGLFTGTAPVAATDTARALLIAGGGGGVSVHPTAPTSEPVNAAGNGNDAGSSGGGSAGMQGIPGQPGAGGLPGYTAGGGGGYVGGGYNGGSGRGGTGYLHTDMTAGEIKGTPRVTPVTAGQALTVQGSTNPYYQDSAGRYHGLMVIVWNPPALP